MAIRKLRALRAWVKREFRFYFLAADQARSSMGYIKMRRRLTIAILISAVVFGGIGIYQVYTFLSPYLPQWAVSLWVNISLGVLLVILGATVHFLGLYHDGAMRTLNANWRITAKNLERLAFARGMAYQLDHDKDQGVCSQEAVRCLDAQVQQVIQNCFPERIVRESYYAGTEKFAYDQFRFWIDLHMSGLGRLLDIERNKMPTESDLDIYTTTPQK